MFTKQTTKKTIIAALMACTATTALAGMTNLSYASSNNTNQKQEVNTNLLNKVESVPYSYFVENADKNASFIADINTGETVRATGSEMEFNLNSESEIIKVRARLSLRLREELTLEKIMNNLDKFKDLVVNEGVALEIDCGSYYSSRRAERTVIVKLNNELLGVKRFEFNEGKINPDSQAYYLYDTKGKNVTKDYSLDSKVKAEIDNHVDGLNEETFARSIFIAYTSEDTKAYFEPFNNILVKDKSLLTEKTLANLIDTTGRNVDLTFYSDDEDHKDVIKDCEDLIGIPAHEIHACRIQVNKDTDTNKNKNKNWLSKIFNKTVAVNIKYDKGCNTTSSHNIKELNNSYKFLSAGKKQLKL